MFPNSGKKKVQTGEVLIDKVDPLTGAVVKMTAVTALAIPDMTTVSEVKDVAGANPTAINLRDHPELNGQRFLVGKVRFSSGIIDGRETQYCILEGWIYPPSQKKPTADQHCLVITGSDNIYQRAAVAFANDALPIVGTLRFAGRARFLD